MKKCPLCNKAIEKRQEFGLKTCINEGELHEYEYGWKARLPQKVEIDLSVRGKLN